MASSSSTPTKGKGKASDVKLVSKPVVFTGFKEAPDLAKFINKLPDSVIYDVKLEHTISIVFKDPALAENLVKDYDYTGFPFEGQQLSIKHPDGAQQVGIPDKLVTPLFNYGATRVLRLSSHKDDSDVQLLTPADINTLNDTGSEIIKMYKPSLPENAPLRVVVIEFSSVAASVSAHDKIMHGKCGPRFAKWSATYGPDPRARPAATPTPSATSAGPLKDSAADIFKGKGSETVGVSKLFGIQEPVAAQPSPVVVGDLIDLSSSGSEPDKEGAVEELTEGVASLGVAAPEKGGMAGSKWAL